MRAISAAMQSVTSAAKSNINELGPSARAVAEIISKVIIACKNAASATSTAAVREEIINNAKAIGTTVREFLTNAKILAADSANPNSVKKLSVSQSAINDAITKLISALASGK